MVLRRESDDEGDVVGLTFSYEKLQKYCSRCLHITHEAPFCPERPRDQRREPLKRRNGGDGEFRGRQRIPRDERGQTEVSHRVSRERTAPVLDTMASSSRRKPVRRDILPELENTTATISTKEWVRKSFHTEGTSSNQTAVRERDGDGAVSPPPREKGATVPTTSSYRRTEEEAQIANQEELRRSRALAKPPPQPEVGLGAKSTAARVSSKNIKKNSLVDGPDGSGHTLGSSADGPYEAHDGVSVVEGGLVMGQVAMGLASHISPTGIIFPLREFMGGEARASVIVEAEERSGEKSS